MMEVNDELVDKLANLARLKFDGDEKQSIKSDLEKMIGFIKKLDELDTNKAEPLLHITPNVNIFREDTVQGAVSNDSALQNAARSAPPYFIVPQVIKK